MIRVLRKLLIFLVVLSILFTSGVYAIWKYHDSTVTQTWDTIPIRLNTFIDLPEHGIDISDRFLMILNNDIDCDVTINSVAYDLSYDALIGALNSSPKAYANWKYTTLHNNSYIGTMQTTGDDVRALRIMFGDVLEAWENETEGYQLMIKRSPIDLDDRSGLYYFMDGDHNWADENTFYPGADFILFSTNWQTDKNTPNGYVIVYATVYTRYPVLNASGNPVYDLDADGNIQYHSYIDASGKTVTTTYPMYLYRDWVKLNGENGYIGYAQVVNYSTGDTTRSFDTGSWISAGAYGTTAPGASLSAIVSAIVGN